ncbi:hypothetical protein [Shinella sp. M31]|uniref:hypothetical protein n=1 Tax=Shinella sp. M31 TaxID=3368615 RepID=UPI003B9DF39F
MTNENEEIAFISADYDEFKPETFRGYVVKLGDVKKTFRTLDEAATYADTLGVPYANLSSLDDYEIDQKNMDERDFAKT